MRLELATFDVSDAAFSKRSELVGGRLLINKEELENFLSEDHRLNKAEVHLALPGEKARIVHVLDVVEPRFKVSGQGCVFPGFLGPPWTVGEGRTHCLAGVAVIESAELHYEGEDIFLGRRIIDMSGPAAQLTPFSSLINVVLAFEPAEGVSVVEYVAAIRMAGLKAAQYLAQLTKELKPNRVEVFKLEELDKSLPRVAYVYQVYAYGPLFNCCFYGQELSGSLPALVHPNELLDGALIGRKAFVSIETYIHCNNPLVTGLYRLHGKDLNFLGVIITPGGLSTSSDYLKERVAHHVAKLLRMLRADGAILTQEGGGNSIMDQMLICRCCERAGIKTVLVSNEMGGTDGSDAPLIYAVPEADAIVSVGNREEKILLPPVERVVAGESVFQGKVEAKGGLEVHTGYIKGAVNQVGCARLKGWDF